MPLNQYSVLIKQFYSEICNPTTWICKLYSEDTLLKGVIKSFYLNNVAFCCDIKDFIGYSRLYLGCKDIKLKFEANVWFLYFQNITIMSKF